jgi:hypothetical protein
MTTKAAGGKITGLLALTLEAQSALNVGDPVHMVGDYMCDKADGSKPVVGFVSVANRRRGLFSEGKAGVYPVANVPGDVTVEARGYQVLTLTAGTGGVTDGALVGIGAAGTAVATGTGVATIGIALESAAAGAKFDCLIGPVG